MGSRWFAFFENLENVRFILQFGFARDYGRNLTEAVGYIHHALIRLGGCNTTKLQAVELGNEPNLYQGQHARGSHYNIEEYANEATKFIEALQRNMTCLGEGRRYQVFQKSSEIDHPEWFT